MQLYHGDCLVEMYKIPDHTVDMILCDLPYGTTACKWDTVIPFEPLWEHYWRVLKPNGAVVLFGSEPFSSYLRMSQIKYYKYDWMWRKTKPSGHLNAKKQPMRKYEQVAVFFKEKSRYFPQGLIEGSFNNNRKWRKNGVNDGHTYGKETEIQISKYTNYPSNELNFSNPNNGLLHPTQKPIPLLEYLINTYTNEGDVVLDNCMGSGSTGIACININRNFIGIEKDDKYFEIAKNRIENASVLLPSVA